MKGRLLMNISLKPMSDTDFIGGGWGAVSTSRGRQDDVLGYRWHEPPWCYSH